MRSQHFGFIVPIQILSEAELICTLPHAFELTKQILRQMGGLNFEVVNHYIPKVSYTVSIEVWLNEFGPEIQLALSQALVEFGSGNEMKRMLILKEALSWRWLKFRDEAIIAQIYLSLTMDKTVHVMLLVGWNEHASEKSIDFSFKFPELFYSNLGVHGVEVKLTTYDNSDQKKAKYRPYGQRLDTTVKLTKLYENREKERARGEITTTRQTACELVGIALSTFKKYNAILYERWYDKEYKATI